jgi:DNA-binding response OmpR family regulator
VRADEPISVLIVDANREQAIALASHLRSAGGFRVDVHFDGKEAAESALRQRPDAIICEIELPGLSGFELAAKLRRSGCAPIFWVALTTRPQHAEDLFAAGFDRYFQRPVSFVEVETALRLHTFQRALKAR